jgi:hypothetical protein
MRIVYALVLVAGLAAVVADHLASPSSARAVSPEDFAGACAPCGGAVPVDGEEVTRRLIV